MMALQNEACHVLDPVHNTSGKDYNEMLNRLLNVLDSNINILSNLQDVNSLDDDTAATFILNCPVESLDFGTQKRMSISLMYAMLKMCKEIKQSIKKQFASRYENFAIELAIDITDFYNFYCQTHWEKSDKKNYKPFPVKMGRRSSICLNDQREVIRTMFWLETIPTIDKLSIRDIRPHVQIMIRQSLEMLFKQIIGFEDIVDIKGNRIKQFTQIGAKFLSNYRDTKDQSGCSCSSNGWRIELKVPIKTLERLNSWCNNFTHAPFIHSLPIIYFAYDQYERFTNKCITQPDCKIIGESKMRSEFECYVLKQNPKACVKWPNKDITVEATAAMRRTAIKINIGNLRRALFDEYILLCLMSPCSFIRKIANFLFSKNK